MLKLLFWLIVALVIGLFFAIRQANRLRAEQQDDDAPQTRSLESVRCAQCGVFVPADEAVRRDGQDFCSWEHAQAWAEAWHKARRREQE
ncbi:PP0621 family protein [Guyparkeria halophila]|uniref:PP0621 family protein n=1 Tax=Guyparkeria halophila TaxID=47960 RepID=A0ABZ0YWJ9_9GAMM|nr:PP0621 family protein [Guyparkeria halophila]WQH16401.1 PP0621 family protein [Guyparkeria halophila]